MSSAFAARSFLRSTSRHAASRFASASKPKPSTNPFSFNAPKQSPLSVPRIFRSPVEMSSCVDSLLPYHTATASSLLKSMLSDAPRSHGWTPEGRDQTR